MTTYKYPIVCMSEKAREYVDEWAKHRGIALRSENDDLAPLGVWLSPPRPTTDNTGYLSFLRFANSVDEVRYLDELLADLGRTENANRWLSLRWSIQIDIPSGIVKPPQS